MYYIHSSKCAYFMFLSNNHAYLSHEQLTTLLVMMQYDNYNGHGMRMWSYGSALLISHETIFWISLKFHNINHNAFSVT